MSTTERLIADFACLSNPFYIAGIFPKGVVNPGGPIFRRPIPEMFRPAEMKNGRVVMERAATLLISARDQLSLRSLFYHTDRPSWTGRMLRQTCAKPEMRSARAAISDRSIILPPTKGPRSVIRTTTERPFT